MKSKTKSTKTGKITKTATSQEFEKFKKNHEEGSTGLGDTVEKITRKTGVKKAVKKIFDKLGSDCGCDERQKKLNSIFRYEKPECFNEEDFNVVKNAIETKQNKFTPQEQENFVDIYTRVFPNLRRPECTPCSFKNEVYNRLVKVYNTYK
jgi:hypothetical protein